MKIKNYGKQASFRLLANFIQAITFVLVSRFTETSEIGILSFLLTINAFQVAFFDLGLGKKILLGRNHKFLVELMEKVLKTSIPFIAFQIALLIVMKTHFTDISNIFFIWSFTIATERILDYFQIYLLSCFENRLAYGIMLIRRIAPLVTLTIFIFQYNVNIHTLDIYIISTLITNILIICLLSIKYTKKEYADLSSRKDFQLTDQTKSFALLSILEQYKNLDIILIMVFFGSSNTGEYSLIARLFNPLLLVIGSILTQMVQEHQRFNIKITNSRKPIFIIILGSLSLCALFLISKTIISLIYGFATENMYFYFIIFIYSTISYLLSGIIETQYVINFKNRDLARTQIWIYGITIFFTLISFIMGELEIGLFVYSSANFIKCFFLFIRIQVLDLDK